MSESFPVPRVDLSNYAQASTSTATNPLQKKINPKSQKLFEAFFDTPEKCQMAINAINSNELGNSEHFSELVDILERRKFEVPNGRGFTQNEQMNMTNYGYVIKELEFVLAEEEAPTNKVSTDDRQYTRRLRTLKTAQDCQVMTDKLLDSKNLRGDLDTQQEVRKMLELIEEKKAGFESGDVAKVEDMNWRDKMQKARKFNSMVVSVLQDESNNYENAVRATKNSLNPFQELGLGGTTSAHQKINNLSGKLSKHLFELSRLKDSHTVEEFGQKVNELLGSDAYDVALVEKLAENHDKYKVALSLSTLTEAQKLDNTSENIEKLETVLGGKKFLETHISDYSTLGNNKYKFLQTVLGAEIHSRQAHLGGKTADEVKNSYEQDYKAFVQKLGVVEDANKALDDFREDAMTAGNIAKGVTGVATLVAAAPLCAIAAGGATTVASVLGASKAAASAVGTVTMAGSMGVVGQQVSYHSDCIERGINVFDKESVAKAEHSGELRDIRNMSYINGAFNAASVGVGSLAWKGASSVAGKALATGTGEAVLALGNTASIVKYNGGNITDIPVSDAAINAGVAFAAGYAGARYASRVVKAQNAGKNATAMDKWLTGEKIKFSKPKSTKAKPSEQVTTDGANTMKNRLYPNGPTGKNVEMTRPIDFDSAIRDLDIQQGVVPPQPPKPVMPKPVETQVQAPASKVLYKKGEAFVVPAGDDLYMGDVKISAELLEKIAQSKSGRLGNMAKYSRTLANAPEGTAILVKKAENGYMVTVKGGEVAHSPKIKETPVDATKPMVLAKPVTSELDPRVEQLFSDDAPIIARNVNKSDVHPVKVTLSEKSAISSDPSATPTKSTFVSESDYADIWFNNRDRSLAVDVIANDANLQVGESMIIGNVNGAKYKINAKSPIEIKITRESDGLIIEQFQGPVPFKLLSEN